MAESNKIKVVVVGCGHMGSAHARAYKMLDGFELVALVARGPQRRGKLAKELGEVAEFNNLDAEEYNRPPPFCLFGGQVQLPAAPA
ncbi:hypothetical protein ES703_78346 [subsurface metagenome]